MNKNIISSALIAIMFLAAPCFAESTSEDQLQKKEKARIKCGIEAENAGGPKPAYPDMRGLSGTAGGRTQRQYDSAVENWRTEKETAFNNCMVAEGF